MDATPPTHSRNVDVATNKSNAPPLARSVVGGVLMGMANLVPGISGGTMILVIGLYDEFITSIADVTRLRFTKRNIAFLGVVGLSAIFAIAILAGTLSRAVTLHRSAMYSLFIGLTLGGAPLLLRMIKRVTPAAALGMIIGLSSMVLIAVTQQDPPNKDAVRKAVAQGTFVVEANYTRDVAAGALGMSAMVLPGISGAYMLLLLNRYETILAAIALAKDFATSFGKEGDAVIFMQIIIPTAVGAIFSLVLLSNLLKWLLHHHEKITLGLLLGVLLGSVIGIWPFDSTSHSGDFLLGGALAASGFAFTLLLSRVSA